jgi:hypothetical protein
MLTFHYRRATDPAWLEGQRAMHASNLLTPSNPFLERLRQESHVHVIQITLNPSISLYMCFMETDDKSKTWGERTDTWQRLFERMRKTSAAIQASKQRIDESDQLLRRSLSSISGESLT